MEACLTRLRIEQVDPIFTHHLDGVMPIEETVGALADLIDEGKVRGIGLIEVSTRTLRHAVAVHPVAAVQTDYSLWARAPEEDMLPVCRELGVAFVPYSPLGRGFLTGTVTSLAGLAQDDYRRIQPRFDDENLPRNLGLLQGCRALAERLDCTPAQLALAWVLAQGTHIIPVPGTKRRSHLEQNIGALDVTLSPDDLSTPDAMFPQGAAAGARYDPGGRSVVDL